MLVGAWILGIVWGVGSGERGMSSVGLASNATLSGTLTVEAGVGRRGGRGGGEWENGEVWRGRCVAGIKKIYRYYVVILGGGECISVGFRYRV